MTACDTDATHTRPTTHDAHTKSTPSLNPFPSPSAVTESFHGIDPSGGFPKEDLKDVKDKTEKDKKDTTPAKHPSRVDTTPLEGVHTLACAIIAANHWSLWYGEKKHGAIELQGGFAVTVFFFITGFVMFLAYGNKACREDFEYWVCLGRFGECLSRGHPYLCIPNSSRTRFRIDILYGLFGNSFWQSLAHISPNHPQPQDFIKRHYVRLIRVHWLCIIIYTPVIFHNYQTIADDYYFWQNERG